MSYHYKGKLFFSRKDDFWRESNSGVRQKRHGTCLSQLTFRYSQLVHGYEPFPYRHGWLTQGGLSWCIALGPLVEENTVLLKEYCNIENWFLVRDVTRLYNSQLVILGYGSNNYHISYWRASDMHMTAEVYAFISDVLSSDDNDTTIEVGELL